MIGRGSLMLVLVAGLGLDISLGPPSGRVARSDRLAANRLAVSARCLAGGACLPLPGEALWRGYRCLHPAEDRLLQLHHGRRRRRRSRPGHGS